MKQFHTQWVERKNELFFHWFIFNIKSVLTDITHKILVSVFNRFFKIENSFQNRNCYQMIRISVFNGVLDKKNSENLFQLLKGKLYETVFIY